MPNPSTQSMMGQALKKYRLRAKMTQKQVAEILNIDEQYYGQIERGAKRLSLDKLITFCSYFHITLDDVIQIHSAEESDALKQSYLADISAHLEQCSSNQLALIQNLIKNIDLFKKS